LCARQRADLSLEALALELLGSMEERAVGPEGIPQWMPRALELLHDRYAEDLSIAQVAAAAGIHPIYLARTFRRHFRCTPGAFTRFRRLEKAVGLLSSTASPLTEVALASGFADQSHLTHAFARWFGVSPAQYRMLTGRHDRSAPPALQLDKTGSPHWSKLRELAAATRRSAKRGR
jgi:AraC family transcriptional regulator